MELAFLSAVEQARLIRAGEASSVELVAAVPRTDRADRSCAERVRDRLRRRGAGSGEQWRTRHPRDAPFHGVPIAVKDLAATAGIRTTYSSRAYADYVPDFDTAVVRRIRDAGFVIVGKTNTPEFGTVAFTESDLNGATRNPWNTDLTPGGSSGGAAAAVVRRSRADRPCHGWRRLDPHPGVVLRPLRSETVPRTCVERTVRLPRGPLDRRADGANGRGRSALPRRSRRLRARRSVVGSSTRATVRGDDRRSRLLLSASRSPRRRRSTSRSIPSASPALASRQPSCSRSSATTSGKRRRRGARLTCSTSSSRSGRSGRRSTLSTPRS